MRILLPYVPGMHVDSLRAKYMTLLRFDADLRTVNTGKYEWELGICIYLRDTLLLIVTKK